MQHSDFEEEDYAPSERHGTAAVTRDLCLVTMLQPPQPLPFEVVEIRADVYPPPKVTHRARESTGHVVS